MMEMLEITVPMPGLWRAVPRVPSEDEGDIHRLPGEAPATRAVRVLIVEDETFVAMYTEAILTAAGHDVVGTAASADEAVAKAAELSPDLVLVDIRLKGSRDGIDAAAEIRRRFDFPVIFVTANADPLTHARAMQVSPLAIISKPIEPDNLLGAVEAIIRG